jgi:signal transduction histidine kinase
VLTAALVAGCALGAVGAFALHLFDQTQWPRYYAAADRFGANCRVSVDPWAGSFDATLAAPHRFRPLAMPYRGGADAPAVRGDEALVTRCDVATTGLAGGDFPWLSLGTVFGPSTVFIDGQARASSAATGPIGLPLTPQDTARAGLEVTIVSRGTDLTPGLASLLPPYVTASRDVVAKTQRWLVSFYGEQSVFRFALAALTALFAAALWRQGLSYGDVRWFAAMAAAVAWQNGAPFLRQFFPTHAWPVRAESAFALVWVFATAAFHVRVVRAPWLKAGHEAAIALVAAAAAGAAFAVSEDAFYALRLLSRAPAALTILVLVGALARLVPTTVLAKALPIEARRRNASFCALAALNVVLATAQIVLEDRLGVNLRPISQAGVLVLYGGLLVADLARRQRLYFEELRLRQAREREADEARALAATARMVAHDLRRPFNMVRLFHERVLKLRDASDIATFYERMLPDMLRAHQDVDAMLQDLASADGAMTVAPEPVRVDALARGALARVAATVVAKRIEVRDLASAAGWAVVGDATKLQRVLDNFVENALQAMPEAAVLSLAATPLAVGGLRVAVHNTGSSVPPELRAKVFELGFTRGKRGGSGLGLAVAKRVVEAHGGRIGCDGDDSGTTFWFELQAAQRVTAAEAPPAPAPPRAAATDDGSATPAPSVGGRDVLLVADDDELQALGWEILVKDALLLLVGSPPELRRALTRPELRSGRLLVVLDFEYQGFEETGFELADAVRAACPSARIAVVSNHVLSDLPTPPAVDLVMSKTAMTFAELWARVDGARDGSRAG